MILRPTFLSAAAIIFSALFLSACTDESGSAVAGPDNVVQIQGTDANPDTTEPEPAETDASTQAIETPNEQAVSRPEQFQVSSPPIQMTPAQQAALPTDCLADTDGNQVVYCYSPSNRTLTRALVDGSTAWSFPLPGEDATNHIEGLVALDESQAPQLIIIADIGQQTGESRYEMSSFLGSGGFINTVDILGGLPASCELDEIETGKIAVNVDGRNLLVAGNNRSVFVAGDTYQLIANGNAADVADWSWQGSFLERIDPATGSTLARRNFPMQTFDGFLFVDDLKIEARIDQSYRRLDTQTFFDGSNPFVDGETLASRNSGMFMQFFNRNLAGDFIQPTVNIMLELWGSLSQSLDYSYTCAPTSEFVSEDCFYDSTVGDITQQCPLGGRVTHTGRRENRFVVGLGQRYGLNSSLVFQQCQFEVPYSTILPIGVYTISGSAVREVSTGPGRRTNRSDVIHNGFSDLTITFPDATQIVATGDQNLDINEAFSSASVITEISDVVSFSQYSDSRRSITDLAYDYRHQLGNTFIDSFTTLQADMDISAPETDGRLISVRTDQVLSRTANYSSETGQKELVVSGSMQINDQDGNAVSIMLPNETGQGSPDDISWAFNIAGSQRQCNASFDSLMLDSIEWESVQ